jgi:branched-chain amino acid transport system permease protein
MGKMIRWEFKLGIVLIVIALIAPILYRNEYGMSIIILCMLWAALGTAGDITHFIGLTNFGLSAYFAVGAYTSGMLSVDFNISPFISLVPALLVSTALGALVGFSTLRFHGIFASAAGWLTGEFIMYLIAATPQVTQGYVGLLTPVLFGGISRLPYYYVILLIYIFELVFLLSIIRGKIGFTLRIIGDDEVAARTIGVNIARYKTACFMLQSSFLGLLGWFYGHYLGVLTPTVADISMITIPALAIGLFGGRKTLWGSALAAFILIPLTYLLNFSFAYRFILYGVVIVVFMLYSPKGLAEIISSVRAKFD